MEADWGRVGKMEERQDGQEGIQDHHPSKGSSRYPRGGPEKGVAPRSGGKVKHSSRGNG